MYLSKAEELFQVGSLEAIRASMTMIKYLVGDISNSEFVKLQVKMN